MPQLKKKKKKAVHQNLGFDMLICEIMFDPWKRSTDKEALLCWSHNVAPNTDMYANSSRWRPRQENWKCQPLPYLTHLSMFHELSLTILNKQRPVTLTLGPVFMWQLECKKKLRQIIPSLVSGKQCCHYFICHFAQALMYKGTGILVQISQSACMQSAQRNRYKI